MEKSGEGKEEKGRKVNGAREKCYREKSDVAGSEMGAGSERGMWN